MEHYCSRQALDPYQDKHNLIWPFCRRLYKYGYNPDDRGHPNEAFYVTILKQKQRMHVWTQNSLELWEANDANATIIRVTNMTQINRRIKNPHGKTTLPDINVTQI